MNRIYLYDPEKTSGTIWDPNGSSHIGRYIYVFQIPQKSVAEEFLLFFLQHVNSTRYAIACLYKLFRERLFFIRVHVFNIILLKLSD